MWIKCFILIIFFLLKNFSFFFRKNTLETHDVFPYRFFPRKNMWSPGVYIFFKPKNVTFIPNFSSRKINGKYIIFVISVPISDFRTSIGHHLRRFSPSIVSYDTRAWRVSSVSSFFRLSRSSSDIGLYVRILSRSISRPNYVAMKFMNSVSQLCLCRSPRSPIYWAWTTAFTPTGRNRRTFVKTLTVGRTLTRSSWSTKTTFRRAICQRCECDC